MREELPWVCWLCGGPIDPLLNYNDRMSWTLDHVISLKDGGAPMDPANARPAHRSCNSRKGAGLARGELKVSRDW
jgi:5-methylcytosine-specific restriction endonuclease McrA